MLAKQVLLSYLSHKRDDIIWVFSEIINNVAMSSTPALIKLKGLHPTEREKKAEFSASTQLVLDLIFTGILSRKDLPCDLKSLLPTE